MTPINWQEDFDDYDNSIWEGSSPYDNDGTPLKWRLKQMLGGNKIIWYADHDGELGDCEHEPTWASAEEAKAAIQHLHNEILASIPAT